MPSGTGETGGPGRRPVTEGLPGPEPAASSGAACAAATQSYRFRAEATSSHTCTANSGLFFSFQLTVGSQGQEAGGARAAAPGILGPRPPSLASLPDSAPGAAKRGLGRSGLVPGSRLSPLSREGCVGTGQVLRQDRVQTRPRSSPPPTKPRTILTQPARPRPKASEPWQMRDSWEAGGRRPWAVGAGLPVRSLLPGAASRPGPLPAARWGLGGARFSNPRPSSRLPQEECEGGSEKGFLRWGNFPTSRGCYTCSGGAWPRADRRSRKGKPEGKSAALRGDGVTLGG